MKLTQRILELVMTMTVGSDDPASPEQVAIEVEKLVHNEGINGDEAEMIVGAIEDLLGELATINQYDEATYL